VIASNFEPQALKYAPCVAEQIKVVIVLCNFIRNALDLNLVDASATFA
jgi:hypothetical protein